MLRRRLRVIRHDAWPDGTPGMCGGDVVQPLAQPGATRHWPAAISQHVKHGRKLYGKHHLLFAVQCDDALFGGGIAELVTIY